MTEDNVPGVTDFEDSAPAPVAAQRPVRRRKTRMVTPTTITLPLWGADLDDPDCEWIVIQNKLSYGDQQRVATAIVESMEIPTDIRNDEKRLNEFVERNVKINLNAAMDGPFKMLIWLVDWNVKVEDEEGREHDVEISLDTIQQLEPESAEEILRVITEHEATVSKKGKAKRNGHG